MNDSILLGSLGQYSLEDLTSLIDNNLSFNGKNFR